MIVQHVNKVHEATCTAAEAARQQGVAAAIAADGSAALNDAELIRKICAEEIVRDRAEAKKALLELFSAPPLLQFPSLSPEE